MPPAPPSPATPSTDLSIALVGPGRVGRSLASWARHRGARIVAVVGPPSSRSARVAADELDAEPVRLEELAERSPDLVLLAVPDDSIAPTAERLAATLSGGIVLHVSGSFDRSVLRALEEVGAETGSLHPLRAFPSVQPAPPEEGAGAARLWFAVDGTPPALATARHLAASWGARTVEVDGESRRAYHLAASLAAGGVVTLLAIVARIARESGLPREVLTAYLDLARSSLDRIEETGDPVRALTGPLVRGDLDVVRGHREALERLLPEAVELWSSLGRTTLDLAQESGLQEARDRRLEKLLEAASEAAGSKPGRASRAP